MSGLRCDPHSREFLIHYARVMLREARLRRGQNVGWMVEAAAKARRQAMAVRPAQGDLFSAEPGRAAA